MGPVRVGNDAYSQQQNDVYGAVVLAATQYFFDQRLTRRGDLATFHRLERLGERAAELYDAARRRAVGIPRPPARAHLLERDVLGRVRPARAHRRAPRRRPRARNTGARSPIASTRMSSERGWNERLRLLHRELRTRRAGRQHAAAAAPRLPARRAIRASQRTVQAIENALVRGRPHVPLRRRGRLRRCRRRRSTSATSGTSTRSSTSGGRERGARAVRATCSRAATPAGCCRRTWTRRRTSCGATFRRPTAWSGIINAAMRLSTTWEEAL